jgi:hypothetical protein
LENPYPFHLCQPDGQKSCGACCGLYNLQDHSRRTLTNLLRKKTELFHVAPKDGRLIEYREAVAGLPFNPKLLETIYNCEFLGFIDPVQRRVGCLLHPSLHDGEDQRYHSFYGPELCSGHFCPSYTHLAAVEQAAVIATVHDWYLYGLVITDIDLVKEFMQEVQTRLGDHLRLERLACPGVTEALVDFFRLKEFWKFASSSHRLGKYFFSYDEYRIARIDYEKQWKMKPSRFNKILLSLASEFQAREDIEEAETVIETKIKEFLRAYTAEPR